ncbi:hypothetical protein [Nonomuraea sp. LPB2021202275-12-8]|uniref:hypothetical protein n=1 Tax=Nonomuraea sp. LPB2021202275-12-8 TaxID=3120159 RepID=UPI00300C6067
MTAPASEPATGQELLDVVLDRFALHAAIYRGTNAGGILRAALSDTVRHTRGIAEPTTPLAVLTRWARDEANRRIDAQASDPRNAMYL